DRVLDFFRGLPRGVSRLLGQAANLLGDNGETATGLTSARSFDRGVKRKNVGLERNLVDGLDDFGDAVARISDGAHGGLHFLHLARASVSDAAGFGSEFPGVRGST